MSRSNKRNPVARVMAENHGKFATKAFRSDSSDNNDSELDESWYEVVVSDRCVATYMSRSAAIRDASTREAAEVLFCGETIWPESQL